MTFKVGLMLSQYKTNTRVWEFYLTDVIKSFFFNLKGHDSVGVSEHFQILMSWYKANIIGILYFKRIYSGMIYNLCIYNNNPE